MTLKLPIWALIPALALFTLIFFLAFENYTIQEWINGNMLIAGLVGFSYLGEAIYHHFKN